MPSKFRDNLIAEDDKRIILTKAIEPCLKVYPYTRFLEFVKKMDQLSVVDLDANAFRRATMASASDCQLDGHGRILVPPALRAYAGIGREVLWTGMSGHAELWDIERFEEATKIAPDQVAPLARAIAAMGL